MATQQTRASTTTTEGAPASLAPPPPAFLVLASSRRSEAATDMATAMRTNAPVAPCCRRSRGLPAASSSSHGLVGFASNARRGEPFAARASATSLARPAKPARMHRRAAMRSYFDMDAPDGGAGPGSGGGGGGPTTIPDSMPSFEERGAPKPYFPPVGVADDPTLANPLVRQMMLSTSWFGCVFDLEGVLIKSREREHRESWMRLAKEHDHPPPPEMVLKHCDTMKPEVFIARQLMWTRDPMQMRRLNEERVKIFEEIVQANGLTDELQPGVSNFLELLQRAKVPMAVMDSKKRFGELCESLERMGIAGYFENPESPTGEPNVVSGEDVSDWLPDPLPIERACTAMGRTTKRCVVFGNNTTVTEACMECGAKSVLLLGRMPRYELQGADTVVDKLTDLSIENLKRLFTEETSDVAEPQREKVEIFPTKFASPMVAERSWEPEAQGDDVGGKEPPDWSKRRRRRPDL